MITFKAEIERFGAMGEKTGWSYIFIPAALASILNPSCKTSYRVKGLLDNFPVHGMAVMPMGEGDFLMALKAEIRKQLKKEVGAELNVQLEVDTTFKIEMPVELEMSLQEDQRCMGNFLKLPKSHQNYFINWLNSAKTEATRIKRLTMIYKAMEDNMTFPEMMRASKAQTRL
jgi:hypothetical protein